jgi:hypothetical protein
MRIHIYYRHYNISGNDFKNRPEWFDYEKCYDNLIKTSIPSQSSLNVVYDGVEDNWIKDKKFHKLYEIKAGNDMSSFFQTCHIIKNDGNVKDGDLIYFLENDYLHVDGWVDKVLELFQIYRGLDYVSLYDHKDKYFLPMYDNLVSKVFTTENHHWRSTPSTCGSFVTTKERFDEDYDILSTMKGDHNKWLWLNQNRSRTVITPIPGLSTHCMNGLLSPTINWNQL